MNEATPFTIAAVSDQPIFLRGLCCSAAAIGGFALVGEAQNGADAVQLCQMTLPDLVLVDL